MIAMLREHGIRLFAATTWYALSAPPWGIHTTYFALLVRFIFLFGFARNRCRCFRLLGVPFFLGIHFFIFILQQRLSKVSDRQSLLYLSSLDHFSSGRITVEAYQYQQQQQQQQQWRRDDVVTDWLQWLYRYRGILQTIERWFEVARSHTRLKLSTCGYSP